MAVVRDWYEAYLGPYMNPIINPLIGEIAKHPGKCALGILLGSTFIYYQRSRPRNMPPGPRGLPFIGSPHVIREDVHQAFDELAQVWGELFTVWIGMTPVVVLNSHSLIKEALVERGDDFSHRARLNTLNQMDFFDEIYNKSFSQEWVTDKKFLLRSLRKFGFGTNIIEDHFKSDLDKLYNYLDSLSGEPTNLGEPLANMAGCTIARMNYGADYQRLDDPELAYLQTLVTEWGDSLYSHGMKWHYWMDNTPLWVNKILFPNRTRRLHTANHAFIDFIKAKIEEHERSLKKDELRDMIDCYLVERGDDDRLTRDVLACNIIVTILDAVGTAPLLMLWVVLYLASFPDWQKKVQQQIDEVCGKRRPGFADRARLPLVEATIAEVGRIVTPITLTIAHSASQDTLLKGYTIPKGSYLLGNLWAANRDPKLFPQGGTFQPEALLNADGEFMRTDKIMFFGTGRRTCLGEQMSRNELFLFVSNTLQRYRLEFPPGAPPSLQDEGGLFRTPAPFTVRALPRDTLN